MTLTPDKELNLLCVKATINFERIEQIQTEVSINAPIDFSRQYLQRPWKQPCVELPADCTILGMQLKKETMIGDVASESCVTWSRCGSVVKSFWKSLKQQLPLSYQQEETISLSLSHLEWIKHKCAPKPLLV